LARLRGGETSFKKDHLRYFVTVAEEGQITRAAKRLFIAQPALSQAISQLEVELGLQLLERHPRGVRLTSAGEAFLEKAKAVVASEQTVSHTAESLARAARGVIELGFIGPPPTMTAPDLFAAFAEAHPDIEISLRDLPFPCGATRDWLDGVDVALCQPPMPEAGVCIQPVRSEDRVAVVGRAHRLAGLDEAPVAELLRETFISYHPDVQQAWAGFHSLDDHRGGPPRSVTGDRASRALQMLGALGCDGAVTTLPRCDAEIALQVLPNAVAVPISDARPAVISLVWPAETHHPIVGSLVALASRMSRAADEQG
jgi:LysR family transcriptional regulator, benzoate and cis,cis-muconate-responsive activator of ben and cat genes